MAKNNTMLIWVTLIIGIVLILNQLESSDFQKVITIDISEKLDNPPVTGEVCTLSINPNTIYVGEKIIGTVVDGANTGCMVLLNSDDKWYLVYEGITNDLGILSVSETIKVPGEFILAALCGDCVTNRETLTVLPLPLDSDGDGFTDDEENSAGTNPNDPSDYPGSENGGLPNGYTCGLNGEDELCYGSCPSSHPTCVEMEFVGYNACACISEITHLVHPDWKPDGTNHYPKPAYGGEAPDEEDSGSTFCTDNDFHLGFPAKLEVKSSCEDSSGTYWDYCSGDLIHDWFCDGNDCSDALGQSCNYFVPGSSCIDGVCYKPPTDEEICADRCPNHGTSLAETGTGTWDCMNYADSWCVANVPPEGYSSASSDGLCCCWDCQGD